MIGLSLDLSLSGCTGGGRATGTAAFTRYGVKPYLVLDGPSNQYLTRTPELQGRALYGVVPYFVMDAASNQFLAGAA